MFGKKRYKKKFWCSNCGCDFKVKLLFGVMPTKNGEFYYLYDIGQQAAVDQNGNKVPKPAHVHCTRCGSFEVNEYSWRWKKDAKDDD